eukprot:11394889-Alexandrium_andersonii.AAC.1
MVTHECAAFLVCPGGITDVNVACAVYVSWWSTNENAACVVCSGGLRRRQRNLEQESNTAMP